ncbi:MAG: 4Fe-4S dicluster domain-containing protein [Lachnospiraceae bacterium]|nr:4Fe-4S dicluster domain-containing protein [Lachnospiraceae bacterium]
MKRVYVNEQWCLGCHLCEYNCAFANSGKKDMVTALAGKPIYPRVHVEGHDNISYAVSCRHCKDPLCVKSCIAGALYRGEDGVIRIHRERCVSCYTCVLVCPYGALLPGEDGAMQKCELCLSNSSGEPACVKGCPNRAIVYEERGDSL